MATESFHKKFIVKDKKTADRLRKHNASEDYAVAVKKSDNRSQEEKGKIVLNRLQSA